MKDKLREYFLKTYTFRAKEFYEYDDEEFIKCLAHGVLNRDYDIEGTVFYSNQLRNGHMTKEELLCEFCLSKEGKRKGVSIYGIKELEALNENRVKHILVLGTQVPFVRGGAELLNESLVREINKLDGYSAELVQLPFKWYPEEQMRNDTKAWTLIDLTESNGIRIDLVIATKFPTYAVNHSNKVLWLVHQHRTLYDLADTEYDGWGDKEGLNCVREELRSLDSKYISEIEHRYTIADNVTNRLMHYNAIKAETLFPPAPFSNKIVTGKYSDYILYFGRMTSMKRVDLLIESLKKSDDKVKAVLIGKGEEMEQIRMLIEKCDLTERCILLGYVSEETLVEYLADCRAVFYAPVDEDFGYATIEAFLAKKLVITCEDSGEVRNIVQKTGSGIICENDTTSIANAINEVFSFSNLQLEKMSLSGFEFAKNITWENVIKKLVMENIK